MVGTVEQGLADMARRRVVTEKLNDYDRALLGGSLRLDIPWTDPVAMRKIGEILIGLGSDFKAYSVRGDLDDVAILSALKHRATTARRRILETAGKRATNRGLRPALDTDELD